MISKFHLKIKIPVAYFIHLKKGLVLNSDFLYHLGSVAKLCACMFKLRKNIFFCLSVFLFFCKPSHVFKHVKAIKILLYNIKLNYVHEITTSTYNYLAKRTFFFFFEERGGGGGWRSGKHVGKRGRECNNGSQSSLR